MNRFTFCPQQNGNPHRLVLTQLCFVGPFLLGGHACLEESRWSREFCTHLRDLVLLCGEWVSLGIRTTRLLILGDYLGTRKGIFPHVLRNMSNFEDSKAVADPKP